MTATSNGNTASEKPIISNFLNDFGWGKIISVVKCQFRYRAMNSSVQTQL